MMSPSMAHLLARIESHTSLAGEGGAVRLGVVAASGAGMSVKR
jgi:hypothetical protein